VVLRQLPGESTRYSSVGERTIAWDVAYLEPRLIILFLDGRSGARRRGRRRRRHGWKRLPVSKSFLSGCFIRTSLLVRLDLSFDRRSCFRICDLFCIFVVYQYQGDRFSSITLPCFFCSASFIASLSFNSSRICPAS
jgi:hypothetical protein